jgi:hypothetical protein
MTMTLDELLQGLEKTAGVKLASDDKKEEDKAREEKDAKKDEEKAGEKIEDAKKDVSDAKRDEKAAECDEEKEDGQCKEARLQGVALANEIMSKVAARTQPSTTKDKTMKKEAAAAGQALAEALIKAAAAGDVSTENGVAPATVPQKNIVDSAQIVAEDNAKVQPLPTSVDGGVRAEGDINQILEGIVQDAIGQGATSYDQGVGSRTPVPSAVEEKAEEHATPNQVEDEVEKAAAVQSLVQDGYDFDTAVQLVKAAEEELKYEDEVQVKQAALAYLIEQQGVDFNTAVALVKQANMVGDAVKGVGKAMSGHAASAKENIRGLVGKNGLEHAKSLAMNPLARGAAGAAAAGAGAYGVHKLVDREKKAAFDALTQSGVDFDSAAALVNAKSKEIYGM